MKISPQPQFRFLFFASFSRFFLLWAFGDNGNSNGSGGNRFDPEAKAGEGEKFTPNEARILLEPPKGNTRKSDNTESKH